MGWGAHGVLTWLTCATLVRTTSRAHRAGTAFEIRYGNRVASQQLKSLPSKRNPGQLFCMVQVDTNSGDIREVGLSAATPIAVPSKRKAEEKVKDEASEEGFHMPPPVRHRSDREEEAHKGEASEATGGVAGGCLTLTHASSSIGPVLYTAKVDGIGNGGGGGEEKDGFWQSLLVMR